MPGPRFGGQLGGLLRARDHQRRPGTARTAVRAVPVRGPGRAARHRPGHRAPPPRGGHPVRLRHVRPGQGRPGRQRDRLPAADGDARRGPGARLLARAAARSVVPAGRPAAVRPRPAGPARRRHPAGRDRAGRTDAAAPPPPGHPLRRDGDLRPAGRRGVPGRVGPDAEPHRAAVGQGRLRLRGAGQVRPARPGHADRAAGLLRAGRAARTASAGTCSRSRRRTPGVYEMLQAADTVGVFQVESRAQMATLPRLRPGSSTTSSSRSR